MNLSDYAATACALKSQNHLLNFKKNVFIRNWDRIECNSVIWSPASKDRCRRIDQARFIRKLFYVENRVYASYPNQISSELLSGPVGTEKDETWSDHPARSSARKRKKFFLVLALLCPVKGSLFGFVSLVFQCVVELLANSPCSRLMLQC